MPTSATNSWLSDFRSAALIPDSLLTDNVELAVRSPSYPKSLAKITLAKLKQYLAVAGGLLPGGGSTGQALVKTSNSDYTVAWASVGVAAGGTTGQALVKNSNADYDASWATVQAHSLNLDAYSAAVWTAGSQIPVLTAANTITLIPIGATAGHVLDKASGDSLYQPIGTYLTANQNISCTGDVTGTGTTAITLTIANGAVSLAKMANLAANSILGNNTGVAATPIALTAAQVAAMLPTFTLTANGLVPAPGGAASGRVLHDDGSWSVPTAGATTLAADTDVSLASPADGQVLTYDGPSSKWKNKAATGGGGGSTSNQGLTLLSAQTVAAVSSVVFDNSKITSTFSNYIIRVTNVVGSATGFLIVQLSPDNGTTIRSASYQDCYENWGITTNFQQYVQNAVTTGLPIGILNTDTTLPYNGESILHGLLSASVKKFARCNGIQKANDGNLYDHRHASYYNVAEAINYLKISNTGGGTFSGTFELYGINDTASGGGKRLIPFFFTTAPAASEVMAIYVCTDIFTIAANLAGTQVKKQTSGANPAADLVFTVYQNSTSIGTITIHSDGSVTLAGAGCTTAIGDVISVVAPATPQTAALNWAINLVGGL